MKPPVAEKRPVTDVRHGIARTDDYAWLRADNWREVMRDPSVLAPDIRAYLEAENDYAEAAMADVEGLRLALFEEMRGRIKEDDSSVPTPDGALRLRQPLPARRRTPDDRAHSAATAATRRCCSTPMRWRRGWPISVSAASPTAPTTG